jgi:hypothetical protein
MLLNPSAMRAGKGSQVLAHQVLAHQVLAHQVLAHAARLNRSQLHRRTASGALRTLVLRVEHCVAPSVRCSEFARKPTGRVGFEGIGCNDAYLNLIAFGVFE